MRRDRKIDVDGPRRRSLGRKLAYSGVALLLVCLLGELVCRWVVPSCEVPLAFYDTASHILRYDPSGPTAGIHTIGPLARQRTRWHINAQGWNHCRDYLPAAQRNKPLVAVIGDSYVEAFQVDVDESIAARLERDSSFEAYGFGMSGAPLSQYLHVSRHVVATYGPAALVFVVVHNDYGESIASLRRLPWFLQLDDELTEVPPTPYVPSSPRRLLAKSALVRYAWRNLRLPALLQGSGNAQSYNANIDPAASRRNADLLRRATRRIIARIRKENPELPLLFVADAPRADLYRGALASSDVAWLNRDLEQACRAHGCSFLDLTDVFAAHYAAHGLRFDTDADHHWNELGHSVAAKAVRARLEALIGR